MDIVLTFSSVLPCILDVAVSYLYTFDSSFVLHLVSCDRMLIYQL